MRMRNASEGDDARHAECGAAGLVLLGLACVCGQASAQAPEGPMAPKPGIVVQQPPPEARLKVRVSLVNTPVTVRDGRGK